MLGRGGVAAAQASVAAKDARERNANAGTKVQIENGQAALVDIDGFVPVDQMPAPPLIKVLSPQPELSVCSPSNVGFYAIGRKSIFQLQFRLKARH